MSQTTRFWWKSSFEGPTSAAGGVFRRQGDESSSRFAVCTLSMAMTRLAGEKIYYDRGTVLRQLGIFHEPQSILGQISILATHPATIARALARKVLRKWRHAPKTASKRIALPDGNAERRVEQKAGLESTGSRKR